MTRLEIVTHPTPPDSAPKERRYKANLRLRGRPARTRPPPGQFVHDCQALGSHSTGAGKRRKGGAVGQCRTAPALESQCCSRCARDLANARQRQGRPNDSTPWKPNDVPAQGKPNDVPRPNWQR